MKTQKAYLPATLTLLSALSVGFSVPSMAGTNQYEQTQVSSEYGGWADPAMAGIAANAGRSLLQHLRSAQASLDTGKIEDARNTLISTSEFADSLERMMPYVVVVDDITNAKNKLMDEDVEVFNNDLLPIYARLDEMSVYAPKIAKASNAKIDKAAQKARQGDKKAAVKTLQEVSDDISATTVFLPVRYVDGQVYAAMNALRQSPANTTTAKKAISNALDSLSATVDAIDLTAQR